MPAWRYRKIHDENVRCIGMTHLGYRTATRVGGVFLCALVIMHDVH